MICDFLRPNDDETIRDSPDHVNGFMYFFAFFSEAAVCLAPPPPDYCKRLTSAPTAVNGYGYGLDPRWSIFSSCIFWLVLVNKSA